MARKSDLRNQREGTVINKTSKRQEKELDLAIREVQKRLQKTFPGIKLNHQTQWYLKDVVASLRDSFPDVDFHYYHDSSSMRPDGGILYICAKDGKEFPILIAEKKNQGTNDLRVSEGKRKQAKGNAIERLGKNVIGFRAALLRESIFPFICFGDGCDFSDDSSILDRVVTIAMFGRLNQEYLHNMAGGTFNRGSFYFRVKEWTSKEMADYAYSIAEKSVYYYYSKYGNEYFVKTA
jgi:type II restriction enzyme